MNGLALKVSESSVQAESVEWVKFHSRSWTLQSQTHRKGEEYFDSGLEPYLVKFLQWCSSEQQAECESLTSKECALWLSCWKSKSEFKARVEIHLGNPGWRYTPLNSTLFLQQQSSEHWLEWKLLASYYFYTKYGLKVLASQRKCTVADLEWAVLSVIVHSKIKQLWKIHNFFVSCWFLNFPVVPKTLICTTCNITDIIADATIGFSRTIIVP